MTKKKPSRSQLLSAAVLFFAFLTWLFYDVPPQIPYRQFISNYLTNTTQIDRYGRHSALIYLNNKTKADYSVHIYNETDFLYQLDTKNYKYQLYNSTRFNFVNDFIRSLLLLLFLVLLVNHRMGGFGNFVEIENTSSTKLSDVAGLDDIKKEVFEFVEFLKKREEYTKVGARIPRGALFYGPPGTGKTLIAKAIAGETDSKFIVVSGSDFSEMYIGVGASRVRKLFAKARANSPSIIFIDEIDALGRTRSNSQFSSQDKDNTLNRLLTELDGFSVNDKVMVFGATNRLDVLDKALLRPGRFDRKIRFSLPEKDDRFKIFNHYLDKMQLEEKVETLCEVLTKQSCGFSCADIANICNEASILAVRDKNAKVKRRHLESALDYIILGPEKKSFALCDKEKRIVAFHEAGHAVTALMIKDASDPIKISIMPRGKSALGFTQSENNSNKLRSKNELWAQMCVLLGGRVSEELNCSDITTGACDDIRKLTNIARQYVCTFGMASDLGIVCCPDDDTGSEMLKIKIDNCIQSLIKDAYKNTKKILTKNQKMVKHLTEKLLDAETLYQRDLHIELLKA